MPEETPQLPVSEQEVQIGAPSFFDKIKLQKKKILIGLGVFFGVLFFTGAVFGIYKYNQKQIQPVPQPIPTPLPAEVTMEEGDPTADWETYTNTEDGYSIKYPPDWFIEEKEDLVSIYNQNPQAHKFERTKEISAGVFDYPEEDFIFQVTVNKNITPLPILTQEIQVAIGGIVGVKGILIGGEGEKILVGYIVNLGKAYNFYGRPADSNFPDHFDLILSTFKFLEEGKVELKTYRSDKYNFEFKYPPNFELKESFSKTSTGYDWLFINLAKEENMPPPGTLPHIQISVVKSVEPKDFSFYEWTEVVGKITIGGIEAEIRQHKSTDQKEAVFLKEGKTFEIISMNYSEDSSQEEVFNQILSTFRFLD